MFWFDFTTALSVTLYYYTEFLGSADPRHIEVYTSKQYTCEDLLLYWMPKGEINTTMDHKQEDCYFFMNSTCLKGDYCRFRHCEAAKGTKTICRFWLKNRCLKEECPFRHTRIVKKSRISPLNEDSTFNRLRTIRRTAVRRSKLSERHNKKTDLKMVKPDRKCFDRFGTAGSEELHYSLQIKVHGQKQDQKWKHSRVVYFAEQHPCKGTQVKHSDPQDFDAVMDSIIQSLEKFKLEGTDKKIPSGKSHPW